MATEEGDAEQSRALERVVERFATLVRQVGRSHRLDPSDIDLLLQDVRVRLWKTGARSENLDALGSSYLYRVAMSAAIDMIRKRRSAREETLDEPGLSSAAALRVEPVDLTEQDEVAERMRRGLAGLVRNRRVTVQLHLEGYTRDEIAALTGWTEAKVRNLLYRGLEDLRARLDEHARASQ